MKKIIPFFFIVILPAITNAQVTYRKIVWPINDSPLVAKDSLIYQKAKDTEHSREAWALVAGGSKGIGYAIAEALARRGFNLILIARHMDSLIKAKETLES